MGRFMIYAEFPQRGSLFRTLEAQGNVPYGASNMEESSLDGYIVAGDIWGGF